ncbi:MAG: hypothetical protein COB04_14195 [Gammaproteobacteria bacterium]|nr:MAG: hypothetical protein COB04_14195 [Gammaproteobacteria bacterium]
MIEVTLAKQSSDAPGVSGKKGFGSIDHRAVWGLGLLAFSAVSHADLTDFAGQFSSQLEEISAIGSQNTFNSLDPQCAGGVSVNCDSGTFQVYANVRDLVHTANELSGSGPTAHSLGIDFESLGFALRWTAAEETSAQESMASDFVTDQFGQLAGRLTALRRASRGTSIASNDWKLPPILSFSDGRRSYSVPVLSFSGSEQSASEPLFTPTSAIALTSYGWGNQEATELEDAFDFTANNLSVGFDYRLSPTLFTGLIIGFSQTDIEFDSTRSIADGGIESEGVALTGYVLFYKNDFFFSSSLGFQSMDFDMTRRIIYPSLNLDASQVNETALSSTDAQVITSSASVGYSWQKGKWSIEPSVYLQYVDIEISAFDEDGSANGFDFRFNQQNIYSLEATASVKAQYAWSNSFGVVLPFVSADFHSEQKNDSRTISAEFLGVSSGNSSTAFQVATDAPDANYYTVSLGANAVVRGSRQKAADSASSGGVQVYFTYQVVLQLENYNENTLTTGLRYEF